MRLNLRTNRTHLLDSLKENQICRKLDGAHPQLEGKSLSNIPAEVLSARHFESERRGELQKLMLGPDDGASGTLGNYRSTADADRPSAWDAPRRVAMKLSSASPLESFCLATEEDREAGGEAGGEVKALLVAEDDRERPLPTFSARPRAGGVRGELSTELAERWSAACRRLDTS